ncbi:MAG: hypothetical protein P8123_07845, partial [bacterium]
MSKPAPAPRPEAGAALLLAKLWNRGGDFSRASAAGEVDLHAIAGKCGMKAADCWADVDFLSSADLPCIVRINGSSGDGEMLLVLKSMQDGVAGLARGDGTELTLKTSELGE